MATGDDGEPADEDYGKQRHGIEESVGSASPLHRGHWRKWHPYTLTHKPIYHRHKVDRYNRLLNQYRADILESPDTFAVPGKASLKLHDSLILNTPWTAEEKDKFFTALARCGKGNLSEVARRIGTKGLVEVTAYVGLLEEAAETKRRKFTAYDLKKVPAAVEVDEDWLKFEDKMARRLMKREIIPQMETDLGNIPEEDRLFNSETAGELLEMYHRNIVTQTKYTKLIPLSPQVAEAFTTIISLQTRRLLRSVSFLVQARARNNHVPAMVTVDDVRTAIDLLGLPRHFEQHFIDLPARIPGMKEMLKGTVTAVDNPSYEDEAYGSSQEDLPVKPRRISRWTKTQRPWPEEWDVHHGFYWDYEQEEDLQDESDHTTSTLGDVESDIDSLDPQLEPEDAADITAENITEMHDDTEEETTLIQTETDYLEAFDSEHSHLELNRLHQFIKKGVYRSQKPFRSALKHFPSKSVFKRRKAWSKAQEKLFVAFGDDWTYYKDEFTETDAPPAQEWEGFQKRNPRSIIEIPATRKRKAVEGKAKARKRRHGSPSEDEEEEESDHSVNSDRDRR